ncbi:MAG: hypothetical protein CM15mP62_16280 [Rhodospirillaceae bacterium]|nr:MAG: hypothetical protein CM15mP62_16280 [Rhodospirillaceae bacterium]
MFQHTLAYGERRIDIRKRVHKNSKVKETVLLLKKVWKEFSVNGPTKEEVENAKSYLKGSYGLQFTNSRSIAGLL